MRIRCSQQILGLKCPKKFTNHLLVLGCSCQWVELTQKTSKYGIHNQIPYPLQLHTEQGPSSQILEVDPGCQIVHGS